MSYKPMHLRETVEQYLQLGGGYGRPVALAAFGFSREETERRFSHLDEDYHISRYFHLSHEPPAARGQQSASAGTFQINGFTYTHITIDPEIESIL